MLVLEGYESFKLILERQIRENIYKMKNNQLICKTSFHHKIHLLPKTVLVKSLLNNLGNWCVLIWLSTYTEPHRVVWLLN